MPLHLLSRVMLTGLAGTQGLASLLIDLNRTHATNPRWPGHARFHVVWQVFNHALGAVLALMLLWWTGAFMSQRFYLATVITSLPMIAFLVARTLRRLYGGTLHDENGIAPLRIYRKGRTIEFDMNGVMVNVAVVLLLLAVVLFHHGF